jgi:hypothetical protein
MKKWWTFTYDINPPTASVICGTLPPNKNRRHAWSPYQRIPTYLLSCKPHHRKGGGGSIYKICPNWVGWPHLLNIPYWPILYGSYTCCCFNFQNPEFIKAYPMIFFIGMLGKFWFLQKKLSENVSMLAEPHGQLSSCFANVASTISTRNALGAICHLLQIYFRSGYHKWAAKCIFCFKDCLSAVMTLCKF